MQSGDILTDAEADYIGQLEQLWDLVSDGVEGGAIFSRYSLHESIVSQMETCEAARDAAQHDHEEEQ